MGIVQLLCLLALGLFTGVLSTVFDVIVVGSASFLSHVALWVLLNALLAAFMESRIQACLWSIPFNMGWIWGYYITTSFSYEGFARSLVVPLTTVALLSPLLVYALWTAKSEKNPFGWTLSALLVGGTLATSYYINGKLSAFNIVASVLVAFVQYALTVRRFKLTRKPLAAVQGALSEVGVDDESGEPRRDEESAGLGARTRVKAETGGSAEDGKGKKDSSRRGLFGRRAEEPAEGDGVLEGEKDKPRRRRAKERVSTQEETPSRRGTKRSATSSTSKRRLSAKQASGISEGQESSAEPKRSAATRPEPRQTRRPTRRTGGGNTKTTKRKTARERREEKEMEARQREERRRLTSQRRRRAAGSEEDVRYRDEAPAPRGSLPLVRNNIRNRS